MKLLTENTQYKDRLNIEIYFNDYSSFVSNEFGYFILSKNSKITGDDFSMSGCFSGYTNKKFSISGEAITIKMPGVNFSKTILSTLDPNIAGDLSYIDGCSNTNLIGPGRNGEPCVNYLFFPRNIKQTPHTHPSCRIGYVMKGNGYAEIDGGKVYLTEGRVFLLDRFKVHNFCTNSSNMSLMVFHPDSDAGPTDEYNPMKIRTYLK